MKTIYTRWIRIATGAGIGLALVGCGGAASNGAASGNANAAGGSNDAAQGNAATVNVSATDFKFAFDPADVPSGPVTFAVKNEGGTVHDFKISGNGVDDKTTYIQAGKDDSITVDLKPGTYDYVCTVPSHKELGMVGQLTVK